MFLLHHKDDKNDSVSLEGKIASLTPRNLAAGAVVTFEGRVRNHNEGRDVRSLDYSAYDELALKEGNRVLTEAMERFDIFAADAVHHLGKLTLGELALWLRVAASRRAAAFEACTFIIDEIKTRVPVWKKEHYAAGDSRWTTGAG